MNFLNAPRNFLMMWILAL